MIAKQTEVKSVITTTDKQLADLESKFDDLNLSSDKEAAYLAGGKVQLLRQLEEERKALNVSKKVLDELLFRAQDGAIMEAAAGHQGGLTTATFGNDISGFQAAVIHGNVSGLNIGAK